MTESEADSDMDVSNDESVTEIVVFGGMMHGQVLNDIWRLQLRYSPSHPHSVHAQWIQEQPTHILPAFAGHGAVYDETDDLMIVFGGKGGDSIAGGTSNTLYQYSFRYQTWKRISENNLLVIQPRQEHGMVMYGRNVLVFGGNDPLRRQSFRDLWQFNLDTREWSQLIARNMHCIQPPESSAPAVALVRNRLYMYSGGSQQRLSGLRGKEGSDSKSPRQSFDCLFVYDLEENMWISVELKGDVPSPRLGHSLTMIREHFAAQDDSALHPDLQSMYPCLLLYGGTSDKGELSDMYEFYDAEVVVQKQHDLTRLLHQRDIEREKLSRELQAKCAEMHEDLISLRTEKQGWTNKEHMYKAHFAALEENVQQCRRTIEEQNAEIAKLAQENSSLTDKMSTMQQQFLEFESENASLSTQLQEAQTFIEKIRVESEQHLALIQSQQDQIADIQIHSSSTIKQLREQANQIGESHAQLTDELNMRREEAVHMRIHVEELIENHHDTLALMKDKYAEEIKKLQNTFDAQRREHKDKRASYKNVIGKLKAQVDLDAYVFSEEWRIPEERLEILTTNDGMLDGSLVDLSTVSMSAKKSRLRDERDLCALIYTETRVKNKYVLKTLGIVQPAANPTVALIVREKTVFDLREYLTQRKPSLHERIAVSHQIAFALKTLHKARIVLQALHPGVIRFAIDNDRAVPKLCLHLCKTDQIPEPYLAPELQGKQNQIDSYKLDIFALGMCYYFLLTDTDAEWKVVRGKFGAEATVYPSFKLQVFQSTEEGRRMESIIKRCHDLDPAKRPTIDEVLKLVSTL